MKKLHSKLLKSLLLLLLAPLILLGYELFQTYYYSNYIKNQYINNTQLGNDTEWKLISEDINKSRYIANIRSDYISYILLNSSNTNIDISLSKINILIDSTYSAMVVLVDNKIYFNNSNIDNTTILRLFPNNYSSSKFYYEYGSNLITSSDLKNIFYRNGVDAISNIYMIFPMNVIIDNKNISIIQINKIENILTESTKNYKREFLNLNNSEFNIRIRNLLITAISVITITILTVIGILYAVYIIIRWEKS